MRMLYTLVPAAITLVVATLADAALAVWAYFSHSKLAGHGYAVLTLGLIAKSIILISATLFVALLRGRTEKHSDLFYTDQLTGLYNMKAFRDIAAREIHRCSRYGHPFSIAYLDADNFTKITQTVGHKAGDELLTFIADNVRRNIRKSDIVARLGGDNFVLLFPETGFDPARNALITLKTKLDDAIANNGYFVTFSIGAMTYLAPPVSVDEVFAACEAVMFRVKGSGKNAIRHESAADRK